MWDWSQRRRIGLLLSGQIKVNLAFLLEIRGPEYSGRVKQQCKMILLMVRSHVISWCWTTVFNKSKVNAVIYQEILCYVFWQALWRWWFPFPQDLAPPHNARTITNCFADHDITVLVWPVKYRVHKWTYFSEVGHVCIVNPFWLMLGNTLIESIHHNVYLIKALVQFQFPLTCVQLYMLYCNHYSPMDFWCAFSSLFLSC